MSVANQKTIYTSNTQSVGDTEWAAAVREARAMPEILIYQLSMRSCHFRQNVASVVELCQIQPAVSQAAICWKYRCIPET